jgi:AcrR family transcriptional regulator
MFKGGSNDTKTKILKVAFELFGKFGFDGTSVRAIAAQAEVNISAVNYHFKNKENLYWEIMVQMFLDLEAEIKKFHENSSSIAELGMRTFEYFRTEKYMLKNAMKMMMTEGIPFPDDVEQLKVLNNPMGPPGGIYFAKAIQREVPYELSREGLLWGVKATFGSVFHWGFMCCTETCLEDGPGADPLRSVEQVAKDVELMMLSAIDFLKNNQNRFKNKEV